MDIYKKCIVVEKNSKKIYYPIDQINRIVSDSNSITIFFTSDKNVQFTFDDEKRCRKMLKKLLRKRG